MLKIRVMPTLLYKDVGLVKGVGFDSWRRVGSLVQSIKVYNMREVDELIFLDITATHENRGPDLALVDEFADDCFMPLTVGGGIKTVDQVRCLLSSGADKVSICTSAVDDPGLISAIANKFGSQCIVVAIDCKKNGTKWEVCTHSGQKPHNISPLDLARQVEALGAGEILLTSVDLDGTMTGYDLELIQTICSSVTIPVIASGGAGNYDHMCDAILIGGASAVAAASMFHFTQQTPMEAKRSMKNRGIDVRF